MAKQKTSPVYEAKIKEIESELMKADVTDKEKIEILCKNKAYIEAMRKEDPKGFKSWIKELKACDALKLSASVLMFIVVLHGESIGKILSSGATRFIPWKN